MRGEISVNRYLHKGFTLAEMLIVMAIIGILASMMMISSTQSVQTTKAGNIVSTLRNFASAAMTFYTDSMDHFTRNPNDTVNTTEGLKNWVKKYMYSEGNTVKDEGKYKVWNNSGTWWVGYDLTDDKDGIKGRLTSRAGSAGLVGSSRMNDYPKKNSTTNKYPEYNNDNAVWLLIRTNQR